ncbi:hypothetical protein HDE69_003119 [Pedobacter cryoconitis]|uniref:SMI1/KNR4 family protein n=1 Tax=Pedobacter cryoconitis TaxID=188932 RepID=A0A7W8YUI2_9SPHI|nr:hypothetical protein [Pedobacter cryoconitis]MBB5622054.1 hypothetical protein [Pedobacter cryoconitis]
MELHPELKKFIEKKIEPDNLYLPQNYPEVKTFEKFQQGYKYIEGTGEILTGTKPSDFKESWYVICSNDMNDPFFVDLSEQDQGFPVYFSWHGAGSWELVKVAEDLKDFTAKLLSIKKVDQDKAELLRLLETKFDLTIELWKDMYASIEEEEEDDHVEDADLSEWISGKVVIRDIGQQKMKIVHYLKEHFKLTPQQALALSKQKDIEVDQGHLLYLKGLVNYLKELGATAEFVPDKK